MGIFKTEKEAFRKAGDYVANPKNNAINAGFRILTCYGGYKVLIVPDTWQGFAGKIGQMSQTKLSTPFYL